MSKGSGTRSSLLWEVERLLNEVDNLPQVLLMENVPQVIGSKNIDNFNNWKQFLESKGYSSYVQILNAKDYGVAQNRKRAFMVSVLGDYSYTFPEPIPLTKCLNDYLEDEVDERYYINTPKAQELIDKLIADGRIEKPVSNSVRRGGEAPLTDTVGTPFLKLGQTPESVNGVGFIDKGTGRHISNTVYHPQGVCRTLTACDEKQPPLILSEQDDG